MFLDRPSDNQPVRTDQEQAIRYQLIAARIYRDYENAREFSDDNNFASALHGSAGAYYAEARKLMKIDT